MATINVHYVVDTYRDPENKYTDSRYVCFMCAVKACSEVKNRSVYLATDDYAYHQCEDCNAVIKDKITF